MNQQREIASVSEITRRIKQLLEGGFSSVCLMGELSNFKRHTSGHLYFTLKDESAQIAGVMWRSKAASLTFNPEDGMKVVVTGRIAVYEVRGIYQAEVVSMRPVGVGELQVEFERLKRMLHAEGLFNAEHKVQLPRYPERIGIVTSPTGAALQDMLNILQRRFPGIEVVLVPVKVQGPGAAVEIAQAIDDLNTLGDVDVLILARGGGSLEDLWAFNEESVARAIYRSVIPVVSAVGHEIDFTIADFVADLRAPTPSAAAELVVKDREVLLDILRNSWYTSHNIILKMLNRHKDDIQHLLRSYAFNRPRDLLRQFNQRLDEIHRGMAVSIGHRLALTRARIEALQQRISGLDPEQVLRRGYAIVYHDDDMIGSSKELHVHDLIDVRFHDGRIKSIVTG